MKIKAGQIKQILYAVVFPAGLLAVWELLSRNVVFSPHVLPAPSRVFLRWIAYARPLEPYDAQKTGFAAWLLSGELPHDALASFLRVTGGFLIGHLFLFWRGLQAPFH